MMYNETLFKKPASPQLTTVPVSPEEPTKKSKKVKTHAKKSSKAPAVGVAIRETPETPLSKKKEKMTFEKRKGIDLLSKVALTKEDQYEDNRKKSLRDVYKTHPSGSGTVIKTAPSAAKIKPSITNEGTEVKKVIKKETQSDSDKGSDSMHKTDENELDSKFDQEENEEEIGDDEEEEEDEFVKTPSNDSDDETKISDKTKDEEDEEMDYTTNQLYDDVDIRLNKPVQANDETVQKEDTDAELTNI
uniref:Uncharacterized protein n=1 Tax=Tanacetum cinerariifolium TaxID=118510 RepID=A0A6L2MXK4_TANCI|nr:hypothetical protein [Tanacetum cinerariifolium]